MRSSWGQAWSSAPLGLHLKTGFRTGGLTQSLTPSAKVWKNDGRLDQEDFLNMQNCIFMRPFLLDTFVFEWCFRLGMGVVKTEVGLMGSLVGVCRPQISLVSQLRERERERERYMGILHGVGTLSPNFLMSSLSGRFQHPESILALYDPWSLC